MVATLVGQQPLLLQFGYSLWGLLHISPCISHRAAEQSASMCAEIYCLAVSRSRFLLKAQSVSGNQRCPLYISPSLALVLELCAKALYFTEGPHHTSCLQQGTALEILIHPVPPQLDGFAVNPCSQLCAFLCRFSCGPGRGLAVPWL